MSNHHYTKEKPPVVTRNGVSLPLSHTTFGKTSDLKGQSFWTLDVTALNQEDARKFIGDDILNGIATRFARKVAIDLFTDADNKDSEGAYIWENILNGFQNLDTGGATLKELREQLDELQEQALALGEKVDEEGLQDDNGNIVEGKQERYNEVTSQITELGNKMRPIKRTIKTITEKYAAIAAKRQASKAAPVEA